MQRELCSTLSSMVLSEYVLQDIRFLMISLNAFINPPLKLLLANNFVNVESLYIKESNCKYRRIFEGEVYENSQC